MHQTFYIDIDEEITSIIERLRKSKAREVIIVVPKRALLIQSIINLKLLKKEADTLGKKIIIVTQDKFGKILIEKTGIIVEQKLDKIDGEEIKISEEIKTIGSPDEYEISSNNKLKNRIDTIGSPGFFDNSANKVKEKEVNFEIPREHHEEAERLINRELVTDISDSIKSKKSSTSKEIFGKTGNAEMIKNIDIKQRNGDVFDVGKDTSDALSKGKIKLKIGTGLFKKESLAKENYSNRRGNARIQNEPKAGIYYDTTKIEKNEIKENNYNNVNIPKNFLKYLPISGFIIISVVLLIFGYLFLPKATVVITTKTKIQNIDAEIKADIKNNMVDIEKRSIPAELILIEDEISRSFDSTGTKVASNHKARGMITIYNEFSPATQQLVATTRFLSEDGKIFRLVNGISVPGLIKILDETKPGAIEAEVVADEAGEEFNIEQTRFTIPGFQGSGSEKYLKIYAKSFKAMTGGASGTETVKTVSESDINTAKNKLLSEINALTKQKIKEKAGSGFIVLDDSVYVDDPTYKISNSAGETTGNFSVTIRISAKALVVKEQDVRDVIKGSLIKNTQENSIVLDESVATEIGKSDADFTNSQLAIRIHGSGKISPNLDLAIIKEQILGKNEAELEAYLKTYSDISQYEIRYWPTFISGKLPAYKSRLEVYLDNN